LRSFLTDAGLSVLSEAGVAVNPFNRAYRITQNTSVNYMMVAERRA
jgi:2-polyprenyl-3-methyl-5-hydroxy-6-metoxy-1,4-benzoquinol methylase